jgi:hypothetical protein
MKISKIFGRQSAAITALGLLALHAASSHAARCEYIIQSEWNTGFVAAVRITNDANVAINGWSVNWAYTDGTTRTGGWNANISGNNPFTATGVGWNDRINPGQSIEFGVQGNKGVANSPAQRPTISGAVCNGVTPSSSAASLSSSSIRVSSSVVSLSSSSIRVSSSRSSSSSPLSCPQGNSWPDCPPDTWSDAYCASLPAICRRSSSSSLALSSSSISSSSFTSSSRSSSSSSSVTPNTPPVPVLQVTTHGMTVYIDGRDSTDAEGAVIYHKISFGDEKTILHPHAWHTYAVPGDYTITLEVRDSLASTVMTSQQIHVQPSSANQAPIAMLTVARERNTLVAHASASFDPEGTPLTFEWEFANGPTYIGDARTTHTDCAPGETMGRSGRVVVTVSDGELKDTRQVFASGECNAVIDLVPAPQFSYRLEGNKVFVDGRNSKDVTGLSWNFGDGSPRISGLLAEHSYTAPGTYNIELDASGPSLFSNRISQAVVVDFAVSSQSSSRSSIPSSSSRSSMSSLGLPSLSSSSVRSSTSSIVRSSSSVSSTSSNRNHYDAHRATVTPVIDGVADAVWASAAWAPIDVFWLGTQSNPSAQDYSGRYKALWDENYLYLLFDITDDRIFDGTRNALDRYWEDDTVELFIDENKNGGQHGYNTSAWAYHISTYGDVVDYTTSGPNLLNDHIDMRLVSVGDKHLWEMRVRIYGEDYADWKTNVPLKLAAGKLMGFSATYIDNDGSPQRESMMGSVDTQGHKNNQGYLDASVFGSLKLVE